MSEFEISIITEKRVDEVAKMLAPEAVLAIKKGLGATALAVVEKGTVIGALSGEIDENTFEIVSIYVVPEKRRRGAGSALMKKLFELADEENLMVRAEYTPVDSEGATLAPFFRAAGLEQESLIFPIYCMETLKTLKTDSKSLPGSRSEIMTFNEAPAKMLEKAIKERKEEDDLLGEIEGFLGLIDKNISFLAASNGEVKECILAERVGKDIIELTPVWEGTGDEEENDDYDRDMKLMLSFSLDEIRKTASPETNIMIPATDQKTLALTEDMLGTNAVTTLGFVKSTFAVL